MRGVKMSIKNINDNPDMVKICIDNAKVVAEQYCKENPDSLIPLFEKELKDLGFQFEITNQTLGFIPKHKKIILPLAIKYYQLAKKLKKTNEQNHFMCFFQIKGLDDIVPILIDDYYSNETVDLTRWLISDTIYQIRSKNFVKEYLDIVSCNKFGRNRQMIVLLLGKLKEESAIPVLINLLEDEEVRLHAICALGEFKREEFRCYFERFQDSTHPGWRKYAKSAIQKIRNHKTEDG